MNSYDVITVQLPPHVHKFMNTVFGPVYQLSKTDSFGINIISLLSKKNPLGDDKTDKKRTRTEPYKIGLTKSHFTKYGYYVSEEKKRVISRMMDNYFRELAYTYIIVANSYEQVEFKQSLFNFCRAFNISPEDIDVDSLYRDFYRKKGTDKTGLTSSLYANLVEKR